ncbi:hypothetical protein ACOMHN_010809 [Nucella lapillus]
MKNKEKEEKNLLFIQHIKISTPNHHKASVHQQDIPFIHFDYHSEIKGSNLRNLDRLKAKVVKFIHDFDFFYAPCISSGETQRQQTGTMRTNCLDCLDRTNAVQTMIGMEILPRQLEVLGLASKAQMVGRFEEVYRQIWTHNGDHISRIYAGTGALGGGRSKYQDATRSATRAIQNNFLDSSKQEAIDVLLTGSSLYGDLADKARALLSSRYLHGMMVMMVVMMMMMVMVMVMMMMMMMIMNSSLYGDLADKARALLSSRYLHASPNILRMMVDRAADFTRPQNLRVCVATYNVNGGNHFRSILCKHVSLADWLLDAHKTHPDSMLAGCDYDKPVDIFAVGFEEIVDLNASNIMKASTTNAMEWHQEVLKTISRDHKYVVLTHIQLVGVILFIFIRPHLAPYIRICFPRSTTRRQSWPAFQSLRRDWLVTLSSLGRLHTRHRTPWILLLVSKWFDMLFPDVSYPSTRLSGALDRLEKKVQAVQREDGDIDSFFKTEVDFEVSKLLESNTKYFELHTYIQQLERSVERWRGDASELLDPGFPGVFGGEFCIVSDMKAAVYKFVSEHTNTVKHALEVLMRDLLVVMRLQLVDFLSGGKYGQAQPPEVMGKLKHCLITNLLEQQTDHDSSSEEDLEPPLPKRQRTMEPTPEFTRQGEWVAVFYDQGFFIGQVTLVENPGTAHVSFLENTKSHRDYFRWLRVEDVANVDSQYVFRWNVEVLPLGAMMIMMSVSSPAGGDDDNDVCVSTCWGDVAVDKVKTGLGGATGNKGGVGIRFLVHSTSFCFVCAHLAAGQSQVNDRNEDYQEITRRMTFPMGRMILSHDYVFWCGDFNYRIDLPSEEVKRLVEGQQWAALRDHDQLNTQRSLDKAFQGFSEGVTNFPPTYKYDMFSDDWDTSEKARTPAWTDRVLWRHQPLPGCRGNGATQLLYTRAELRVSDHRPVVGLFEVESVAVEEERKEGVLQEVIGDQGPPDATVIITMATGADFQDNVINDIVQRFTEIGEVIIVRFVGSDMWVLYKSGQDALEAITLNNTEVCGQVLAVRLKTPAWRAEIEAELQLCAANTGALFNPFSNTLLGDDFSVPSMDFDMDDQEEEEEDGGPSSTLQQPMQPTAPHRSPSPAPGPADDRGSGAGRRPPDRPPQPSRPDTPPARPPPLGGPKADPSTLVVAETALRVRASPSPEPQRKAPPGRPSAPPVKPPPPQRPPGGPPPKPSPPAAQHATPGAGSGSGSGSMPKVRQPLRPPPDARTKKSTTAGGSRVSSIGLPMNVKHTSHASSSEEAEKLIDLLMRGDSVGSADPDALPPPLKPSASASNLATGTADDGNSLAPRPIPRSRTTQDMEDNSARDGGADPPIPPPPARRPTPTPTPTPRTRSMDQACPESAGAGGERGPPSAPQPRPRPRREAPPGGAAAFPQSQTTDGALGGREVGGESGAWSPAVSLLDAPNSPAPSHPDPFDTRHVTHPFTLPFTPFSSVPPAHPPPPLSQGAVPDPFSPQPGSDPFHTSSGVPPGLVKSADPFDTSAVTGQGLASTAPDPFDTSAVTGQGLASTAPDPFDTSAVTGQGLASTAPDPFDTSAVGGQGLASTAPDPFDISAVGGQGLASTAPDPFDTSAVTGQGLASTAPDPFDTSAVGGQGLASTAPDPFDTSAVGGQGLASTAPDPFDTSAVGGQGLASTAPDPFDTSAVGGQGLASTAPDPFDTSAVGGQGLASTAPDPFDTSAVGGQGLASTAADPFDTSAVLSQRVLPTTPADPFHTSGAQGGGSILPTPLTLSDGDASQSAECPDTNPPSLPPSHPPPPLSTGPPPPLPPGEICPTP